MEHTADRCQKNIFGSTFGNEPYTMNHSEGTLVFNESETDVKRSTDSNIMLGYYSSDDDDDEEDECRVCRGPAEEGRPLFSPCRCSGSIGLVHQDCLKEWLDSKATRGQKCELCGTTFQFAPKYADGAPERLPFHEIVTGILHHGFDAWLPFLFRMILSAVLWLFGLPLATAYLYYGWLHHPSSVMSRWKYELIAGDAVSGAVIASIIIVSFLSLMSFADFLRFHWQQLNEQQREVAVAAQNADVVERRRNILRNIEQERPGLRNELRLQQQQQQFVVDDDEMDDIADDEFREAMEEHLPVDHPFELDDVEFEEDFFRINGNNDEQERQVGHAPVDHDVWEDEDLAPAVEDVIRRQAQVADDNPENRNLEQGALLQDEARNPAFAENRFEPQFEAVQPIIRPDDDIDPVDIQLDLDEILGLRGPIHALVRNILLLLAFNATHLGIFVFIPHTIGYNLIKVCSKSSSVKTVFGLIFPSKSEFLYVASSLNAESRRLNVVILLPDVTTLALGYLTLALGTFLWNIIIDACIRRTKASDRRNPHPVPRLRRHQEGFFDEDFGLEPVEPERSTADLIGASFQCASAVGKVGVLLFLKMLLLPLLLGIGLDAATLTLVGESVNSRIIYAGGDLFGAISIHWVAGITFMLLVTVSVLQLREVVHPDLFARVIRPQEPQPDLLGNLLQESGVTHAKRMLLSFGIYLTLLIVHVWLPAKLLGCLGVDGWMPLFRPRVWHLFLPQLLVPLELLVFHLCMLAFLEKYKNSIGEMQHEWLVRMCAWLGLTDYLLPKAITKFAYVGSRPILMESSKAINGGSNGQSREKESRKAGGRGVDTTVTAAKLKLTHVALKFDSFWEELARTQYPSDDFIRSNLASVAKPGDTFIYEPGVTKRNGQRHLMSSQPYLCLPNIEQTKLPTSIGPYRLRRRTSCRLDESAVIDEATVIEFWREVSGPPIPRPPEGWDDLRVGGAEAQGRWAWGEETRSTIEEGIAHRIPFMCSDNKLVVWAKVCSLLLLSWAATLVVLCTLMNAPILLGRAFFSVLSLPEKYHHDPVNFVFGVCVLLPIVSKLGNLIVSLKHGNPFRHVMIWVSHYRQPASKAKIRVLVASLASWLIVAPLALGLVYRLNIVKSSRWWGGKELSSASDILDSWTVGFMLINMWGAICYLDLSRRNLWVEFGFDLNGGVANPNVQRRNDEQDERPAPVGRISSWQGCNGRIGRFVKNLYDVLSTWEWDQVDRIALLDECAIPIVQHLLMALLCPSVLFVLSETILNVTTDGNVGYAGESIVPFLGLVDTGIFRRATFRLLSYIVIVSQLVMIFRTPLNKWFEKAHKAARDDQYLIGEILLNLEVDKVSSS